MNYKLVNPELLGLPFKSSTASWIDYDNDGLTDLHVFPDGIYHQKPDHQFEKTHILERNFSKISDVFCNWFDADNDGRQDLLIAAKVLPTFREKIRQKLLSLFEQKPQDIHNFARQDNRIFTVPEWKIFLYQNIRANNHWLQVQLTGPVGNRPAIGTEVELETDNGIQHQKIGQAEDSLRSAGHYRIHFGLGAAKTVKALRLLSANGNSQENTNIEVDKLLRLSLES